MTAAGAGRGAGRVMSGEAFALLGAVPRGASADDSLRQSASANPGRYVTARRLASLARTLSPRDHAVLQTLAMIRLATATQLERLHFADVSVRARRKTLASLTERRLLARLPRVVGGVRAGSAGYVYTLGPAGHRLARGDAPRPVRAWAVGTPFLAHSLAVTELYVRLVLAHRAGTLRLVQFVTEPASWRSFPGPGGGRLVLKPDAAVTVRLARFEDRWFVEVDRATESLPTLGRKCDLYRRYWASGREQATSGVFPRVLWFVPGERRCEQLEGVIRRQPQEARGLFSVALFEQAVTRMVQGAQV